MAGDPSTDEDYLAEGNGALRSYLGDQQNAFKTGMAGYGGALDYYRANPYPQQQQGMLRLAAGLLGPTKSGGWAESFGKGASGLADANDYGYQEEQQRHEKMARLSGLQSQLYSQRGSAQLDAMKTRLALPALAVGAQENLETYHDMRNGVHAPTMPSFTPPPVSQVPVDPNSPPSPAPTPSPTPTPAPAPSPSPSPAPGPQSSLAPPNAATARASLRTPPVDVASDYATPSPAQMPPPRLMRLPPGTEGASAPVQPGDYPSAFPGERVPGAPNYNWQTPKPDESQRVRPGVHRPGAIVTENEPVLDDSGRPVNPAALAASGTASDASNAPEATAAAAAARPPPSAAAGAPGAPPAAGVPSAPVDAASDPLNPTPGVGMPAPALRAAPQVAAAPVKVPQSGSYEETGIRTAPSNAQLEWAQSIKQQISQNPRLRNRKEWVTQENLADQKITAGEKALNDWRLTDTAKREGQAAAEKRQIEQETLRQNSEEGLYSRHLTEAAAARSAKDIDEAHAGAKASTNVLPKLDAVEAAYDQLIAKGGIPKTGRWAGALANTLGLEGVATLKALSAQLRDIHIVGPGPVSNNEQQIIEATTAGLYDTPKDFKQKIAVLRAANIRNQEYGKFMRTYANAHAGHTEGADERWQDYTSKNTVFDKDSKTGDLKVYPENLKNWENYAYEHPKTADDYKNMHSNTTFIDPDGNKRTKP